MSTGTVSIPAGFACCVQIKAAFDDLEDAKRILREIRVLRHFNHENVSLYIVGRCGACL